MMTLKGKYTITAIRNGRTQWVRTADNLIVNGLLDSIRTAIAQGGTISQAKQIGIGILAIPAPAKTDSALSRQVGRFDIASATWDAASQTLTALCSIPRASAASNIKEIGAFAADGTMYSRALCDFQWTPDYEITIQWDLTIST